MPRGGFVKFHVDKNGNVKEKTNKSKDALHVKTAKIPILAYEDSNGDSPGHSPTRWKMMKGIEENEGIIFAETETPLSTFALPKTTAHLGDSRTKQVKIKPIPMSQYDKGRGKKGDAATTVTEGTKTTSCETTLPQHSYLGNSTPTTEDAYEDWTSFTVRGRSIFKVEVPKRGKNSETLKSDSFSIDERTTGTDTISGRNRSNRSNRSMAQIVTDSSSEAESLPLDERNTDVMNKEFNRKDKGILYDCPLVEHSAHTEAATFLSCYDESCLSEEPSNDNRDDGAESTHEKKKGTDPKGRYSDDDIISLKDGYYSQKKISESHHKRKLEERKRRKSIEADKDTPEKRPKDQKMLERSDNLITESTEETEASTKPDYTFDDDRIWNDFFNPPTVDANGWVTPKELLSPALFAKTPTFEPTAPQPEQKTSLFDSATSVADVVTVAAENALEGSHSDNDSRSIENKEEVLKRFLEMAMPVIKTASMSDDQQKQIRKVVGKLGLSLDYSDRSNGKGKSSSSKDNGGSCTSNEKDVTAAVSQDSVPFDVKIRRKSFKDAKQKMSETQSIHLRDPPKLRRTRTHSPSSHSLLDDSIGEEVATSVGSETVSTLSFPADKNSKHKNRQKSSKNSDKEESREKKDESRRSKNEKSSSSHDARKDASEHRPLGSSSYELKMLNKFLKVAGPSLKSTSKLSAEDRERLHDKALKEGLPESFVNRMLDRSAGIRRWEEEVSMHAKRSYHSRRTAKSHTVSPSGSDSFHTKSTGCTETNHSRYTRDTESVSYYTYDEDGFTTHRRSPKTEIFVGNEGYTCLDRIANYFWMESDLVGNDMLDNVVAVISRDSGSMDTEDVRSRRKHQRGQRRGKSENK